MSLTTKAKRTLVAAAHTLRPIVSIGKEGLTENIFAEIDRALYDHELIKVRIQEKLGKAEKSEISTTICQQVKAECLKIIGNILIFYRQSDKKKPKK